MLMQNLIYIKRSWQKMKILMEAAFTSKVRRVFFILQNLYITI